MATTDDVLRAVQDLTKTYEVLQKDVDGLMNSKMFSVPLFSDGICYWNGYENLEVDSELYNNIKTYGAVTSKALYGSWNNSFMITLAQGTAFTSPKGGMPDRCFVIKMKLNDTVNKKKTVFFKQPIADNQGYGYISAYLVNKNTLIPYKFLGTDTGDKGSEDGRSIRYDMFNGRNLQMRYHSWNSYNFNLDDASDAIDNEGNVYIGFTSTATTFFLSGWGISNRNTDFIWQNAYVMSYGSQPMSAIPSASTTNNGGLYNSYFARNTTYNGFEIPYEDTITDGVIVSFLDNFADSIYQADMVLQGSGSGTIFRQDAVHIGNFGRLLCNGGDFQGAIITSFIIPKNEVEENTVIRNGKKYLKFDIPKFLSERNFNFAGLYTEEYRGI